MLASRASASTGSSGSPSGAIHRSLDLATDAPTAFRLFCEVEKWPVWLSFLRSVTRVDEGALRLGSEVVMRSAIPGDEEQLYEVDRYLEGHIVSLVGAYSIRRRLDFRLESKNDRTKIVVRLDYPSYYGAMGALYDRLTARRKLETALEDSLVHFKGLAEYQRGPGDSLTDF